MYQENKFMIISLAVTFLTLIAEIGFIVAGNGFGAGLCLVFGIMVSGLFRFLDELKGE